MAWEYVVAGMVTAMEDRATEAGAATVTAMRAGIDAANRVPLREGALPPMERLIRWPVCRERRQSRSVL